MPDCFPKYISKRELGIWLPAVSYNLRRGGHALIDRNDRPGSVATIRRLGRNVVAHGWAAVIFPEGTRARRGELGVFKLAGALALMEEASEAAIVPACLDQSWRVMMHRMAPIPFGIRLRFWIGEPIERRPGEDRERILRDVEELIRERLARFRGETPVREGSGAGPEGDRNAPASVAGAGK
jgi:1-acyl-sn-glycerol-3-phosphate acyltransferase